MPRRSTQKRDPLKVQALKQELRDDLEAHRLTLGQATRRMRRIVGMTQPEYARLLHLAPRVLMDVEKDRGNPTLDTLKKIGRPFNLKLVFVPIAPRRNAMESI